MSADSSQEHVMVVITSPMHPAVVAVHTIWGLFGGLTLARLAHFPQVAWLTIPRSVILVWSLLALMGSVIALWGASQAAKNRIDPSNFLIIEWWGCAIVILTQGIYLGLTVFPFSPTVLPVTITSGVLMFTNIFRLFQILKDVHVITDAKLAFQHMWEREHK